MTIHWRTDLIHKETGKAYRAIVKDTAGEVVLFHSVESLEKRDDSWSPWESDGGGMVWASLPHTPFTEESVREWCAEMWEEAKESFQYCLDNKPLPSIQRKLNDFQINAKEAMERLYPPSSTDNTNLPSVGLDTPYDDEIKQKVIAYFPEDANVVFYNSEEYSHFLNNEMLEDLVADEHFNKFLENELAVDK